MPTRRVLTVVLAPRFNRKVTVGLLDAQRMVRQAREASPQELARLEPMTRDWGAAQGATEHHLILSWIGTPCDRTVAITLDPPQIVIALGSRSACDTLPVQRGIDVEFDSALAASDLIVEYVPPVIQGLS